MNNLPGDPLAFVAGEKAHESGRVGGCAQSPKGTCLGPGGLLFWCHPARIRSPRIDGVDCDSLGGHGRAQRKGQGFDRAFGLLEEIKYP
jgi:hypothetical protein